MRKYTHDELTAKLVGMIEPMPSEPPPVYADGCIGLRLSADGYWYSNGDPWAVNGRQCNPLDNIGDAIRCAEAKYGPNCWELQSTPHKRIAYIWAGDTPAEWRAWDYWYTDNDHALALALALASAVDGERAEVA